MALPKEVDGDITKVEGYQLFSVLDRTSGQFIGFYAFCPRESYIRGAGSWNTATGSVLARVHGAQLVEMNKSFIAIFDKLDSKGERPDEERVKASSTKGRPGSWDTQEKSQAEANKSK